MKRLILVSLSFVLCLVGCAQKGTTISGEVLNADGETAVLEKLSATKATPIDSIKINQDGSFVLNAGELTDPGFYRLILNPKNFVVLLLENGERLEVSGNALDFYQTYSVTGSKGSEILRTLDLQRRSEINITDSLKKVFQGFQMAGHPRLDSIAESIDQTFRELQQANRVYVKQLIDDNPGSLVTLSAVQGLNPDEDLDVFQQVSDNLAAKYPDSEYLKQFKLQLTDIKAKQQAANRTNIGSPAPEIAVSTPDGGAIKLSDFRGKVTMIDFWASWCKPCRMENPNVVKVYNRFKDKGFEIFGVSLDQTQEKWIQAIAQDGLTWKHGSELKFWQSSFVPAYNLDGIPMTYLLDENGIIIAKGLRGEELERKLEELFN